jgi:hypothetical protein
MQNFKEFHMTTIPKEIDARKYFSNSPSTGYSKESVQMVLNNRKTRMRAMLQSRYLGFRLEDHNRKTTITIEHWKYILGYIQTSNNIYKRDNNDDRFIVSFRLDASSQNPLNVLFLLNSETVVENGFSQRFFKIDNDRVVIQQTKAYASIWFNDIRVYNYFPDITNEVEDFVKDNFPEELLSVFRVILKSLLVETEYMLDNLHGLFINPTYITPEIWEIEKARRLKKLSDE